MLEKELNTREDWKGSGREEYLSAMARGLVDALEPAPLLKRALPPPELLADKFVFLTVLSVSYGYEGD